VNVIDNLLDSSKIEPVIAVFVKPNNRGVEYADSLRNQYRLFFVNELVPYIDTNYKTKNDPKERLVLGIPMVGIFLRSSAIIILKFLDYADFTQEHSSKMVMKPII